MNEEKKVQLTANIPKWLRYTILYYSEQLDIPEHQIIEEALLDILVKLEKRRKIKEETTFPKKLL